MDGIVEGRSKRDYLIGGMAGSALTSTMLRKAPYRTVRCLMLEAVPGKTGRTEFQGGRWKRDLKDARASGLPDRNLMDHPIQLSWALAGEPVWPYRGPISTSGIENLRDGVFRRERSALRIQISNNGWDWPTGGALTLADMLTRRGLRGTELRRAVADHASRHVQLAALTEQLPEPENRVTLDAQDRDAYGVPLPNMHYRVGAYARAGLAAAREIHDEIFARLNATEIHHSDVFQGAGHIIGTTRMGDDPRQSVVDRDLRSHDHPNLFLVGSGAFPTSSTANPTLTIAALDAAHGARPG